VDRSDGVKIGAVALVVVAVLALALTGSQTSAVLSTVGAAIPDGQGGQAAPLPGRDAEEPRGEGSGGGDGPTALRDGAKIVYTGSMSLRVDDLGAAVDAGRVIVARLGGYVGGSRVASEGDDQTASYQYRIPSDRWDEGLAALRELGTVIDETTDSAEVSDQIVDLEARIRNLRASETSLQRILEQAAAVKDILEVEERLTAVRGQIEQLDAQRANLEDKAAYGTLTATYGTETVAVVEAARGWDPAQEVDRASATLVEVLQALTSAGIWFGIVWLPLIVALLVVALIVRFVLRRTRILEPRVPPAALGS
jgi:hypothetical protein